MKRIFITATNTDIGKTYATKLLLQEYAKQGYQVGVIKPIETGVTLYPLDGTDLFHLAETLNPALKALNVHDIVPYQFELPAAPLIASGGEPISFKAIDAAIAKIEQHCDLLLIEGAGGLYVPIDTEHYMIDLITHLQAKTLLITHSGLGCINDTLLSLKALENAKIEHRFAINIKNNHEDFDTISRPYFDATFKNYFELEKDIEALSQSLL